MISKKISTRTFLAGIILACVFSFTLQAENSAEKLVLAANGKTAYQIVISDTSEDTAITNALQLTAEVLRCAFTANGFEIESTAESQKDPEKPGIYLGSTEFAKTKKIDSTKLRGWNYIQKVSGKDIIILGNDVAPPEIPKEMIATLSGSEAKSPFFYRIATQKGVLDFLRDYCSTYFLFPSMVDCLPSNQNKNIKLYDIMKSSNVEFKSMSKIEVPANLDFHKKFKIGSSYNYRDVKRCTLYDLANNLFPRVDSAFFHHTYDKAVTAEKYRNDHPEYFALIGGERTKTNHFCISNPGFQKVLYDWTRKWLELGFKSVNMLHQDGFKKCQCEKCRSLYGTGDDWGEKVWIMQKKMAEKLLKEFPDRIVDVTPYTILINPPKTFKEFPSNIVMRIQGSLLEEAYKPWEGYKITKGFAAGTHNWIPFMGGTWYSPMRTPEFIEKQVKLYHKHNVISVARDGRGYSYGTEGPVYYIYGRLFSDPENLSAKDLMYEYCDAAFGPAGGWMRNFYDRLYHNIKLYSSCYGTHGPVWMYKDIYGRTQRPFNDPFRMIGSIYTPELFEELDKWLSRSENKKGLGEKYINRLKLVAGPQKLVQ